MKTRNKKAIMSTLNDPQSVSKRHRQIHAQLCTIFTNVPEHIDTLEIRTKIEDYRKARKMYCDFLQKINHHPQPDQNHEYKYGDIRQMLAHLDQIFEDLCQKMEQLLNT